MSNNFIRRTCCPVCGGRKRRAIYLKSFSDDDIWDYLNEFYESKISKDIIKDDFYSIVKCKNCSLLYQEYILSDKNMYLLYENWISAESSLQKKMVSDIKLFEQYVLELRRIYLFLKKMPHEINVLEYGMGWGFWSRLAKALNFKVTGVELSESRVEFARRNGVKVIDDIKKELDCVYDYVYSNQVFEHLTEPKKELIELARVLKPGGIIDIKVPNCQNFEKKFGKINWRLGSKPVHPLEHINCFSRQSLKILANQAKLSLVRRPYSFACFGINSCIKGHIEYINDAFFSTNVYMRKNK
ncbi:MAG: class I SAM-dependent methyltransferase [Patescibacteria group bacterium]|nr:class I SAM-dependent methyltransferase [Patescibacteria group bacterium]